MTLHLGFSHSRQHNSDQQQEIREARRLLKERVRNDWEYPALPAYQLPVRKRKAEEERDCEEAVAGFKFHHPSNHDRDALVQGGALDFEPAEWREREYSSAESSDAEDVSPVSAASKKSTYKFDGPDSVGVQLLDRTLARKRKRQQDLDEEVIWNDGLAHWLARRDAWSGAHTPRQVQLLERSKAESTDSASISASASSTPRSSTSLSSQSSTAVSSPSTTPDLDASTSQTLLNTRPPAPPSDLLVPMVPPILVNHPIRKRITSEIYPEIYAKIIIQGRTPSVPINLLHLIRALVQGWKDDGEWPPKAAPLEKSIGRKKGGHESSLRSGVRAVGRVLRITSVSGESSVGSKDKS